MITVQFMQLSAIQFQVLIHFIDKRPVCDGDWVTHHSSIPPLLQRCPTLATNETGLLWLVLKDIQSTSLLLQLGYK